jgi:hypothetical protein
LSSSARKPDKPLGKAAVGAGILDAAGAVGHRDRIETGEDRPAEPAISASP